MSSIIAEKISVALGGHRHKVVALQDVSFSLPEKRIIGLIGPSGAGKTTLIRSIVGRQRLGAGSIRVFGQPAGSPGLRSQVSYMTQERAVYADLSVEENLNYFTTMVGIPNRRRAAEVAAIIEVLNLAAQKGQLCSRLSGGQKQRTSLAVALLGDPSLLLLDEPTVGLDPLLREQLWQRFYGLREQGKTLIISSHVMDEAERCDDLLLIRDGRILAQGTPPELKQQTDSHSVEQAFLKLVEGK